MHPVEFLAALTFTSRTPDRHHAIEHHFAVRNERRLARLERRRRRRSVRLSWSRRRRSGHAPTLRVDPA